MTLLGHGVHITSPQPIAEAIAWHTVPAQLSALRKLLRDAETSRQAVTVASMERLEELERTTKEWFECVRLEVRLKATQLGEHLDSIEDAGHAEFLVLDDRLSALDTTQRTLFDVVVERLDSLDKAQQARLEDERVLTTQRLDAVLKLVEGVDTVHAARNVLLSERIHQLEQAPLKRFWRWLTRKERKNGPTL